MTSPEASPGPPRTLAIARVVGSHGLRGELVCARLTDFPERFGETDEVLIGTPPRPYGLERHRWHRGRLLLKVGGVDDRSAADALRGALVQVSADQAVELPSGSFFWHQIIGLRVEDREGALVGTVSEILPTGANDVYVVETADGELLLPAIKDVVLEVDPGRGTMVVQLMPGLK